MISPWPSELLTQIVRDSLSLFRPPSRLSISEWAETYAQLPRKGNAEPGKYRLDRFPPQRAMLDDALDPTCTDVVWMIGSQLGKTLCFVLQCEYFIHQSPSPILIVYPKIDDAKTFMREKFDPVQKATPCMAGLIREPRERNSETTILNKGFPGGEITAAGANSPSTLRQRSKRVIILDEMDAYEENTEGDPVEQADTRATTFHNAVRLKASTPTVKGMSRIEAMFDQSDKQYWFCPCPKCGAYQTLKWCQVKFTFEGEEKTLKRDTANAVYICEHCNAMLSDRQRIEMINRGEWRATAPFRGIRGRHISGLYRTIGKKRAYKSYLHEFAEQFLAAKRKGASTIQVWTNTFLAETFEAEAQRIPLDPILARCEVYKAEIPAGALCLVAAVDVQASRLEYQVVGFGLGEESWAIDYCAIHGDPHTRIPWEGLDKKLRQVYQHELGYKMGPAICLIDMGGQSREIPFSRPVYNFVGPRQGKGRVLPWGVFACKGSASPSAPISKPFVQANGIVLQNIGVSEAKGLFYSRLEIKDPGPGYVHFPKDDRFTVEYFLQLTAEEVRTEKRHGYGVRVWHKIRERNEALDLMAYCIAAVDILNPAWNALKAKYGVKAEEKTVEFVGDSVGQKIRIDQPNKRQIPVRRRYLPFKQIR